MDNPQVFNDFLTRIGINNARSRNAFVSVFGDTFRCIVAVDKSDLNNYLSNNTRANAGLPVNQQIVFGQQHVFHIHAIGQVLNERKMCDAINNDAVMTVLLNGITPMQCCTLKQDLDVYEMHKKLRKNAKLPDKVVSTDKGTWYENKLAIEDALRRQIGVRELPLSYVIRDHDVNNYDDDYSSREDRLIQCASLHGPEFEDDNQRVYSLLSDYVKDTTGKTVIEKFKLSKNGRNTLKELCLTMESPEYLGNLAVQAEKLLREVVYKGEKGTFGIKKYHQIMTQAFNMLDEAHDPTLGRDTRLSESQKITKFMARIKENDCAKTCIEAERELRKRPMTQQTFNNFYSDMLGSLSKYRTMVQSDGSSKVSFSINSIDSALHDPTAH